MDNQQIVNSLNRVNSALGVMWSNMIVSASGGFLRSVEKMSIAGLIAVVIAQASPRTTVETEMRNTAWHLWMTVITNALLSSARRMATSFVEKITWSSIVLLALESLKMHGVWAEDAQGFLTSTKYLFAETLSSAYNDLHGLSDPLLGAGSLLVLYVAMHRYCPSKTVNDAIGLMVFDALGNMLTLSDIVGVSKLAIALALSVVPHSRGAIEEHIREYSRWEAAREIVVLGAGDVYHAIIVCMISIALLGCVGTDRQLRETVHDVATLAFFDMFFKGSNDLARYIFMSSMVMPFVFTLVLLAVTKARISTSAKNGQ